MTVAEIYERAKEINNYDPKELLYPVVEALWEIALQLAEMNQREAARPIQSTVRSVVPLPGPGDWNKQEY